MVSVPIISGSLYLNVMFLLLQYWLLWYNNQDQRDSNLWIEGRDWLHVFWCRKHSFVTIALNSTSVTSSESHEVQLLVWRGPEGPEIKLRLYEWDEQTWHCPPSLPNLKFVVCMQVSARKKVSWDESWVHYIVSRILDFLIIQCCKFAVHASQKMNITSVTFAHLTCTISTPFGPSSNWQFILEDCLPYVWNIFRPHTQHSNYIGFDSHWFWICGVKQAVMKLQDYYQKIMDGVN